MRWSQNRALQVGYDSSGFECKYWIEASGIKYFNQTNKNTLLHGPTPSSAPEYWSTVLCLYWAHFCMTPMISVIFISKICIFPLQLQSDMRQRWVEPHLWLNASSRCFSTSLLSIEMVAYLTHMWSILSLTDGAWSGNDQTWGETAALQLWSLPLRSETRPVVSVWADSETLLCPYISKSAVTVTHQELLSWLQLSRRCCSRGTRAKL